MSNPKGIVEIVCGGQPYKMQLTVNGLIDLEGELGDGVDLQTVLGGSPKLGLLRTFVWAALRQHQPNITKEQVGDIMQEVGLGPITSAFTKALTLAFANGAGPLAVVGGTAAAALTTGAAPKAAG